MAERARRSLAAGADMALICNDPDAADATLSVLKGYGDPVGQVISQARLITLRRRPVADSGFRGSPPWRKAVAALDKAQAPPGLTLS